MIAPFIRPIIGILPSVSGRFRRARKMVSSEPLGPHARRMRRYLASTTGESPAWGERGFLMEKRRVGTARFISRSTDAHKGSTNNGAHPRLASFSHARVNCDTWRSRESPYIAERYLPRLKTRREWRVSFAPLSCCRARRIHAFDGHRSIRRGGWSDAARPLAVRAHALSS
jgi:hypothetical protein